MSRPLIVAHTGTGGERGRIMSPDGISVALSATDYKDPPKVLVEEKVNGRQNNRSRLTEPGKRSPGQGPSFIGGGYLPSDEGIRFFKDGCCGTLRTIDGCGDKCVIERIICASRGRNPTNPSDRTVGAPTEQRLEPNSQGICNTLTSVAKDNYVLEIRTVDDG